MGLEMIYQAVPAGCGLIERAKVDQEFGELLCHLPFVLRGSAAEYGWAPEFWRAAQQVLKLHPGLESRYFGLDKNWDVFHYLLSATRRGGVASPTDQLLNKAIRGDESIAEHVRGVQGIPLRLVAARDVIRIAELLRVTPYEAMGENYSPAEMEASSVYKFWAEGQNELLGEWLREYYEGFRQFYETAAAHGDDVLVRLD